MKSKTCSLVVILAVLAMGWTVASGTTNDDIVVRVDEATSYITLYPDYGSESNPPEVYPISGYFKLVFETDCASRVTVRFKPLDIVIPTIEAGPFIFPEYPAIVEGISLSGSDDLCSYFCGHGICVSSGSFGWYRGSFDGNILNVTGEAPLSYHWYPYLTFTINATRIQSNGDGVITLPRTGQTECYSDSGAVISCAGTGQDGEIQAGVEWPDPRFTVSGDCVTDKLTGLMWAKNGNPGGWGIWQWALDYVASINSGAGLCGYKDWHLSNINELESLVNAEEADTATWLNSQGFSSVQPFNHWSSTAYAGDSSKAWSVYMQDGNVDPYGQGYYHFVWPVRSGQLNNPDPLYPANVWKTGQTSSYATGDDGDLERGVSWPMPRFTDPGDGTVTDTLTGLMWTKEANLSNGTRTWQGALDYVAAINSGAGLGGYHDWRLPNRKELFSLIDYSRYYPTLLVGHPFQNVQPDIYWSSTTYAYRSYAAWSVSMLNGAMNDDDKSVGHFVWPVRSGYISPPKYPDISITPNPLPFGAVIVGSSSDQSITVKNDGTASLVVGTITTPDSPFSKVLDSCSGQSVAPKGTCTVTYRFSPTAGGSISSNSNIPSNDPDEASVVIELKGTGVNFSISPAEGSIGTTMVLEGAGFGSKKGKVLVGGLATKVTEWIPGRISLTLSKVPASAGTYPVVIQPKEPKGTGAITELEGFTLKGPEIEDLSANHGGLGQVITINGKFFGNKKGKVYLGVKSCKVTSWIMDQAGGNDEIKFQVPKGVTGTQQLQVSNGVGSSGTLSFTVD